jgi:hypothetical protein
LLSGLATFAVIAAVLTPNFAANASLDEPIDESVISQEVDGVVTLAGSIVEVVNESNAPGSDHDDVANDDSPTQLFHITGFGYLTIDVSRVDLSEASDGIIELRFAVPAGLDLGDSADSRYDALRAYTLDVAPLTAIEYVPTATTDFARGMVNQIPGAAAEHKIYAMLVTPANVTGTSAAANQTAAKVAATVAHSSSYWSDQTGGKVTFDLVGTATWYKSAYSCTVGADAAQNLYNSDHIWAEAAAKAETALGYRDGPNKHLVLFFPSQVGNTPPCGDAAGLAIGGKSLNTGGPAWVVGTDGTYEKATLAHELGHNLSYGHASWANCTAANPQPGFYATSGCSQEEYGDVLDVMGGGGADGTGGSLSSPSAIRSGAWPSSAYTYAPPGTTTSYTLNTVSGNSGLRSVIVEDNTGSNYYVEFRNQGGRDAQFSSIGCPWMIGQNVVPACNSGTGVRILRAEQSYYGSMQAGYVKGRAMDNTILIGRTVGGVKKGSFTTNESFSTNGITVTVTAVSGTTATVSITRPAVSLATGYVRVTRTSYYDNSFRVGDTFTALIGASWEATSYKFQWLRNGKAISGATKQSYTMTKADLGKAIKVKLTGKVGSKSSSTTDPSSYYSGYGPVKAGILPQGSVKVNAATIPFSAVPADWDTAGVTYKYTWLRNGKAIKGATKATYTPTSSDSGKMLSAKVTVSKSGYATKTAISTPTNYTVTVTGGAATVTGTTKVGATLTSASTLTFAKQSPAGPIASPVLTRQWLRNGVAISGATSTTYVLDTKDYGKAISVRISGSTPGWASASASSVATAKIAKGDLTGSKALPTVTANGKVLTAALAPGSYTNTPITVAYQWYRGDAAIKKATKASYSLTSADYNKPIKVRATVTKSNYVTEAPFSVARNYSVVPSTPTPVLTGPEVVGTIFGIASRSYTVNGSTVTPTLAYQWLRNGKAIAGQTAATYASSAADKGAAISVKVTATYPNTLASTSTSPATQKLGAQQLVGWNQAATVSKGAGTLMLTANPAITTEGAKITYQWLRGGVAISKATKSTYSLTSADASKLVSVRVTASKSDFTTVVKTTTPVNYTVQTSGSLVISGTPKVGLTLSVNSLSYTPASPSVTYKWYRSGTVIAGATGSSYLLVTGDAAKTITVKATAASAGYLSLVSTSPATAKVAKAG